MFISEEIISLIIVLLITCYIGVCFLIFTLHRLRDRVRTLEIEKKTMVFNIDLRDLHREEEVETNEPRL